MTHGARLHARVLGDADVAAHFSGRAQLQAMLDVEAALAAAEAQVGVIPPRCVAPIRAAARAELYDRVRIAVEATETGNPVIPVVRHLTARVEESDAEAARFVHWGATSQDVLDTGLVLQLRAAVPTVIDHLD
ncbi:MAG: 3-carboxy-cis,cis-muconate cycloisomerase, partial [Acidobacteria bacterium]|nr:3-carboxy-cis,cis-muconate cycloisomerase [Acidobacteriota bacterium]